MLEVEKGAETLPETFDRNLEELAKNTQDKFGGALSDALSFDPAEFNKFQQQFNKFVVGRAKELKDAFAGGIDLKLNDKDGMLEKLATTAKNLKPKLAIRGSQEAFRIGQDAGLQQKMLKTNEQQVKEQKKTNNLLEQLKNLGGGGGIGDAMPFNPNIQAGAGAGGAG